MSRWGRLATLGGLGGRVTSSYLADRVRRALGQEPDRDELHVENAQRIADTLSRMKGAAMKLGQSMAVAATTLDLPPDVSTALGRLHQDAEPVPFETIRADIEASLDQKLSAAFADFDPTPLGTASLAQAHVARLHDGAEVVVKVLHRGVAGSVDTDLLALKAVLLGSRAMRRDRAEVDAAFEEVRQRLSEELDYLQEAQNLQQFREALGEDERVRIPRLHHTLCTDRVLVMDRLFGRPIQAFVRDAAPEVRQKAGLALADLYYVQLFRMRMLHCDPHPGNYLFEDDGRIGIVDFGCVKRYDPYWLATYARAALSAMDEDLDGLLAAAHDLGSWNGSDLEDAELLKDFARGMSHGFRQGEITLGTGSETFMEDMGPILKRFVSRPGLRIPKDVLFTHRALAGMYAFHRQLGTRADFGSFLKRHARYAIEAARG